MRTHRAVAVVLAALLALVVVSTSAGATTTGIRIEEPQLAGQRGSLRFRAGVTLIACAVTLAKTLINGLVAVRPELTKLGKVTAGRVGACTYMTQFLNLPQQLGGQPGPLEESWDISFLSSNLVEGQLHFEILDFQVQIMIPMTMGCLYRGNLLGTLGPEGRNLRYASSIPLSAGFGCPEAIAVEGSFVTEPPIRYTLLVT